MPIGTHISFNGHIEIEPIQRLRDIGDKVIFAIGQFKQEQAFNINVRVGA